MARASRSSRSRKAKGLSVDFTGVEASGKVAEGRQVVTVDGAPELKTSDSSGSDYLSWKFKAEGGVIYHNTSLQPQGLWNLRNVLEAMGVEVPDGKMDLELEEYDGMELGVEVEHETYQGKKKPRIIDVFPADEVDAEEQEEEEEEPKKKGSTKSTPSKDKAKEEEPEELSYDEVMEMEKDELLEIAEQEEIKVPVKTKRDIDALRELIASELGLEPEEEKPDTKSPRRTASRKTGSKEIKKGAKVTFVDDGEDLEGKVKSVNEKEGFAVLDVDGEEWEVELEDITVS